MSSDRGIIVCLDESEDALHAWRWACGNLIRPKDFITLLMVAVIDTSTIPDYGAISLAMEDVAPGAIDEAALDYARQSQMEKSEKFMNSMLANAKKELQSIENVKLEGKILTQNGSIGETISAYLNQGHFDHPVDVVVCGSRGLGAFKRAVLGAIGLGSTSDYLCHHLNTPVIVVRPETEVEPHRPKSS